MPFRYLYPPLNKHLTNYRQMVFLVGPRQVGKTTLAKTLLGKTFVEGKTYFNWDMMSHRRWLTTQIFTGNYDLSGNTRIVFDEIHKFKRWKNTLKGLFDKHEPNTHWIVTGSAAVNVYRKGQDSLLGRHFTYHLFPFTLAEALQNDEIKPLKIEQWTSRHFEQAPTPSKENQALFIQLLNKSGFPESFFSKDKSISKRWQTNRLDQLINQDLAQTENLRNLSLVENLMFLLPTRVGSPLSINSLREDLEVHHATVKYWLDLLERVFYGFRIYPYAEKLNRALKKEPKWYLWDYTEVEDMAIRFENMVALHLLKYVYYLNELGEDSLNLNYLRDKEKREVDFVICRKRKPLVLIEVKYSNGNPSPHLFYFMEKLGLNHAFQLVADGNLPTRNYHKQQRSITVLPAASFLARLV
ncbi:MAG: ATP-binding protein [Deltaproteobacteria bacterium]|nr:ATP-binding protein [Deltaproteobacteria bacterium]